MGFEKTHTLGNQPDESQGHMATLLGRASGPDVCKQLVVRAEGDWRLLGKGFLTAGWADGPVDGSLYRASEFSELIPSIQQV